MFPGTPGANAAYPLNAAPDGGRKHVAGSTWPEARGRKHVAGSTAASGAPGALLAADVLAGYGAGDWPAGPG